MFKIVQPPTGDKRSLTGWDGDYCESDSVGRVVANIMKVKEDKKARDIINKRVACIVIVYEPSDNINSTTVRTGPTENDFGRIKYKDKIHRLTVNMLSGFLKNDGTEFLIPKKIDGSIFKLYPVANSYNSSERECVYIAGRSGSGKSTWMSRYALSYLDRYPDSNINVFSRVSEDIAFNELFKSKEIEDSLKYIDLPAIMDLPHEEVFSGEDSLDDSCCIFDDIDTLEAGIKRQVYDIRNDILQTGRHKNISCLTSSHLMKGGNDTKIPILESHKLVLFPNSAKNHVIDMLKTYGGCDKKDIDKIMKLPSKWVTIQKEGFPYAYHERGAIILS